MLNLRTPSPDGTILPLLPAGVSWKEQRVDERTELRIAVFKEDEREIPVTGIPNYLWIDGRQAVAVSSLLARDLQSLRDLLSCFDLDAELRDPATFGMRIFRSFITH